jgi:myo-inositol-1(or 4)-monophosphatase/deoxyribonuclease-2
MEAFLAEMARQECTTRIFGSGTATTAGVALGRGVASLIHQYSPIDHAAAVLIVNEAGGVVLDHTGVPSRHPVGGMFVAAVDLPTARTVWNIWRAAAS